MDLPPAIALFTAAMIRDDANRALLNCRGNGYFDRHIQGPIIRFKRSAAERIWSCAPEVLENEMGFDVASKLVLETIRNSGLGGVISPRHRRWLVTPPKETRRVTNAPAARTWRSHQSCPPDLWVHTPNEPFSRC